MNTDNPNPLHSVSNPVLKPEAKPVEAKPLAPDPTKPTPSKPATPLEPEAKGFTASPGAGVPVKDPAKPDFKIGDKVALHGVIDSIDDNKRFVIRMDSCLIADEPFEVKAYARNLHLL